MAVFQAVLLASATLGRDVHAAVVLRGNEASNFLHPDEMLVTKGNLTSSVHMLHTGRGILSLVVSMPKIKVRKARGSKAVASAAHDKVNNATSEDLVVLDVHCGEPFAGPDQNQICPDECPYMRFDPDRMCHFKCITAEWCRIAPNMPTSFPDDKDRKCKPCEVAGCSKCSSPTQCSDGGCAEGFEPDGGGKCLPYSRKVWFWIFVVIGILVLTIVVYLVRLWSRPIRQSMRLKQALVYRSMSKVRKQTDGHTFYPLIMNLCTQPICGVGMLLHFRFQAFWLFWSLIVLALAGCLSFYNGRFKASDITAMTPTHEEVFRECQTFGVTEATQIYLINESFKWFTFLLYVFTTIASLAFALSQRITYRKVEKDMISMEDYGLIAEHMPVEDSKDDLEIQYTNFFKEVYGAENVIGVSICWDYLEVEDDVINAASGQLHFLDKKFDSRHLTPCEINQLEEETSVGNEVIKSARLLGKEPENIRKGSCSNFPEMTCLDSIMCGSAPEVDYETREEENKAIAALVRKLKTTGFVFVVFNTEQAQYNALSLTEERLGSDNPIQYPGAERPLRLKREGWEPSTIIWSGFSVHKDERDKNIYWGILITLGVIVIWAVCFYGPYIVYVLSWSSVAGSSAGDAVTMNLLGVMCAIGNQVVYFTCVKVSDMAGFRSKDWAMTFNCCLYTTAVLINILVDVSLMVAMANGFQKDSGMDTAAAIRNPSFLYALYLQLVGYLYPMTLLVPYLAEPIPMNVIPYFLGKWMVRSATKVSRYNAEQAMVCPEFDLLRYGDIIVNVAAVVAVVYLASSSLWWIFMWLFISNLVIYCWDQYRLLRWCEETYFANNRMDNISQYFSALPCGLLLGAYVFKVYGGEEVLKSWEVKVGVQAGNFDFQSAFRTSFSDVNHSLWFWMIAAIMGHVVFHVLVLRYIVPRFIAEKGAPENIEYKETAKEISCTWFNSNPVHCLRSQSLGWEKHDPPFIFHQRGKEYAQKKNPHIHQYYEEERFVEEKNVVMTMEEKARRASVATSEAFGKVMTCGRSKLGLYQKPQEGVDHID